MDRFRGGDRDRDGDRGGGGGDSGGRHSRLPPRWSDGPGDEHHRQPSQHHRGGGNGVSSVRHHPYRGGPHDYPSDGGGGRGTGFRPGHGGGGFGGGYSDQQMLVGGPRREGGGEGFQISGRGGASPSMDGSKFAKLFIGSVPRTVTEEDIRPLFEEHGHVVEVALIKDKRTGHQQSCCFIKYLTVEEADRAIRALHNQYTLPGGMGPIQVRYADGERERLGAVEHKLFVGSLSKQATVKEIEEIFSPYGRLEDVYLLRDDLKQSRGCGFVKFSSRDMAAAAMNALNGVYTMKGCEQPLIVRFADPKRPRPGEARGGPTFGGPGVGPRPDAPPAPRSTSGIDELGGGRFPSNMWHPMSPESLVSSSQAPSHGFGSQLHSKSGGPASTAVFSSPLSQVHSSGPLPIQKPQQSPQHFPSMQLRHDQQNSMPYSQSQTMQAPMQQLSNAQLPISGGLHSFTQPLSQQLIGLGGQLPSSQSLLHQNTHVTLQLPMSLPQGTSGGVNQLRLPSPNLSQLLQQSVQQSPAQVLLQQQAHALQSTFQSPQAFSQLHQQLQLIQPSNLSQQQNSLISKQQSLISVQAAVPPAMLQAAAPTSTSATSASVQLTGHATTSLICNWTEHTSPEGFKYYYNSVTKESKWEKPEELSLFEQQHMSQQQQHQQENIAVQQLQSQSQMQTHSQLQHTQQISLQQAQAQMQPRQQAQLQQFQPSFPGLGYQQLQGTGPVIDPACVQKGPQVAQEWLWKNKQSGT